jgi:hypothetical protein
MQLFARFMSKLLKALLARPKLAGPVQKLLKTRGYQPPAFDYAHLCTNACQRRRRPRYDF